MNLLENEQQVRRNKKMKIIMMVIVICIILLLCLSAGIMYLIYDVQKNMTKLVIDKKAVTKFSPEMFLFEDDTIYISIREFAELLGYKGHNGDYTSEDLTKGYIQNEYEEASYTLNSNRLYKKLLNSTDNEYYTLEKPVKIRDGKLYMSIEGTQIATTSLISYNAENKQFTVNTLPYLTQLYIQAFKDAAIGNQEADFSNQKALLYNMIIVSDEDGSDNPNIKYGVKNAQGKEIIGKKYKSIKFIESTSEFIVTTDNGKMGILSSTGNTKIQPNYDEIKQIDKNLNLYLVKNNNKYGVINHNGNIVIYLEYDQIGIDTTQFASNNIKNQYLLFDNCIAVQRNKKWGFYDKTGKQIVPLQYDELGCILGTQANKSNNNLIVIPEYEAIVVGVQKENGNVQYGLINSLGKELIPCVLDTVYSVTSSGQDSYWMEQTRNNRNVRRDVIEWLQEKGIQKPVKDTNEGEINNTINDNTIANQTSNTTVTENTTNAQQTTVKTNQTGK